MTTIAITATEIAWDSQQTINGNERAITPLDKVHVCRGGRLMAFAGDSDNEVALLDWVNSGARKDAFPEFGDKGSFDMVLITKDGMTLYSDKQMRGVPVSAPICLGSGGVYARGAIELGKILGIDVRAMDAAAAGAGCDAYSGGEIKSLNIKRALGRRRKKATS